MLALLLLLLPCLALAQPDTTWSRTFQIGTRCHINDCVYAGDNTVVFCGYSVASPGNNDFLIGAYTADGESLFVRTLEETVDTEVLDAVAYFGDVLAPYV
ncbi:MAG: hypothetical protein IPG71_10285 [bacterium]|nr:hypothetical protein [bacterium]